MRSPPDPSEIAEIYIDESSQNKHTYLVLGGLGVHLADRPQLEGLIAKARLPELPHGEAKWTKVSASKLPAYKRLVDVIFDHPRLVHCHTLVVDTREVDDSTYNDGNREIGFNKEIYQLATKFARLYPDLFHVYPDYRKTNQSPEELRLILNRGRSKAGDKRDWPFRRCHFRESHECLPLQLIDIVIGSLAYELNGHNQAADASAAKCELSGYVKERAKVSDVFRDTAIKGTFTIWHRRLRKRVS